MKEQTKEILKEKWAEILLLFFAGLSVCFLFEAGLGFLYHKIGDLLGISFIIIGFVLGTSVICYCIVKSKNEIN